MDELDLAGHGLRYLDMEPAQRRHGVVGRPGVAALARRRADDRRARRHPSRRGRRLPPLPARGPPGGRADPRRGDRAAVARRGSTRVGAAPPARRRADGAALEPAQRGRRDARRSSRHDAVLGPALVAGPMVWGISPEQPGTGLGALTYAMRHVARVGRPVGGSGALTEALRAGVRAPRRHAAHRRARSTAILCDGDRVRGRARSPTGPRSPRPSSCRRATRAARSSSGCANPPAGAAATRRRGGGRRRAPDGYESKIDAVRRPPRRGCATATTTLGRRRSTIAPTLAEMDRAAALLASGGVLERPAHARQRAVARRSDDGARRPARVQPRGAADARTAARAAGPARPSRGAGWSCSPSRCEPGFLESIVDWRAMTPDVYEREFHLPGRPRRQLRRRPARRAAHPRSRADPLRDGRARAVPHRRGDVPGRRHLGRQRPQLRHRRPRPQR